MPLSEFNLIKTYFSDIGAGRSDVLLGVGDDCALLQVPDGRELAVSIDTLVSGRHFQPDVDPEALGHKALAVNLSDLAAMGADPAWVTLALSLPEVDEAWLQAFSQGFSLLAKQAGVALVGGDTTRGPLSITVQAHGFVDRRQVMRRDKANPGDLIYVSGQLGDAALALLAQQGKDVGIVDIGSLLQRLERPEPRLELSAAIRSIACAAIDISDGLLADLGHVCESSRVSALIDADRLPLSSAVRSYVREMGDWRVPLAGGDDYELCFTVPLKQRRELEAAVEHLPVSLHRIGVMEKGEGVHCRLPNGAWLKSDFKGFDHFSGENG